MNTSRYHVLTMTRVWIVRSSIWINMWMVGVQQLIKGLGCSRSLQVGNPPAGCLRIKYARMPWISGWSAQWGWSFWFTFSDTPPFSSYQADYHWKTEQLYPAHSNPKLVAGWWFGNVWNIFIFPYIGNVIIPIDFPIFRRVRYTTNQFSISPGDQEVSGAAGRWLFGGGVSPLGESGCWNIPWWRERLFVWPCEKDGWRSVLVCVNVLELVVLFVS